MYHGDMSHDVRPLKRSEYDTLVRVGAFAEERVELLYGVIVPRAPQDPAHSEPIRSLVPILTIALHRRALVQSQLPFAATDGSEPEPDVAVIPVGDYRNAHPDRAFLIVEVANSSHKTDHLKADLYAACGVPEYWIVDVPGRAIEVLTEPMNGTYATLRTYRPGGVITLVTFPDVTVTVDAVLG